MTLPNAEERSGARTLLGELVVGQGDGVRKVALVRRGAVQELAGLSSAECVLRLAACMDSRPPSSSELVKGTEEPCETGRSAQRGRRPGWPRTWPRGMR